MEVCTTGSWLTGRRRLCFGSGRLAHRGSSGRACNERGNCERV